MQTPASPAPGAIRGDCALPSHLLQKVHDEESLLLPIQRIRHLLQKQFVQLCPRRFPELYRHFFGIVQLVIRHGETAFPLACVHSLNAAADGVDHVQIHHRQSQERIPVNLRRRVAPDHLLHGSGREGARPPPAVSY